MSDLGDQASSQSSTDTKPHPMAAVEARRDAFVDTLSEYDDPLVATVAEAVAETNILELPKPNLSVDEWLDVLETTAGDLYLSASSDDPDIDVRWYLRHDGEAFIYGTERYGERYRGDPAAIRQVRAVIQGWDVSPGPMSEYPIEQTKSFIKDSTEGGGKA